MVVSCQGQLTPDAMAEGEGEGSPGWEWEFVARGGLVSKEYSWGNGESRARDYANHRGTGGKDEWEYTAAVGSLKPNGYGLYNIGGNVSEWCQDWYDSDRSSKVLRGGSWLYLQTDCA